MALPIEFFAISVRVMVRELAAGLAGIEMVFANEPPVHVADAGRPLIPGDELNVQRLGVRDLGA